MPVGLETDQPEALSVSGKVGVGERSSALVARPSALAPTEAQLDTEVPTDRIHPGPQEARRHETAPVRALPLEQLGEHTGRERHPGDVVAHARSQGRSELTGRHERVRHPRTGPERAGVVAGPVAVGPVEPVSGQAPVDEPREPAEHRLVIECEPLEGGGTEVGDERVSGRQDLVEPLPAIGVCRGR